MALSAGTRLGPYEILAPLGAGGMGEVYRATDTKLSREVAIKVLPAEVAQDPERLARFQREATLLASLNHPHIAAIYGLEEADRKPFLVLELVEGEDLSERLKRGPIPVEEALEIAKQIAEGLEEAHGKGIIHRDLKPANVKVTPDGKVKVLDFGLAKAWGGDSVTGSSSDLSQSPTLAQSGTQAGVILGTAAYMSPEQARGKPVDRRADVWAFGAVLYEMLTGRRAFAGEDMTDTLAAVVRSEPSWEALPDAMSPSLRAYLRRCLHKDPKQRIHDIADVRLALEGAFDDPRARPGGRSTDSSPRTRLILTSAVALAVVVGGVLVDRTWFRAPGATPARGLTRFTVDLPPGQHLSGGHKTEELSFGLQRPSRPAFALSPDGRELVFVASDGTTSRLFRRPMDQTEATPMPGTEGASIPVFSPEGNAVAFRAGPELKRVSMETGEVRTLTMSGSTQEFYGFSWTARDTLVLGSADGIYEVPATGGRVSRLTTGGSSQDDSVVWPQLLPGGRAVLFDAVTGAAPSKWNIVIESLDTGQRKVVIEGGSDPLYVPSGHILFVRTGTLMAVPFDLGGLGVTGPPIVVVEDVMHADGAISSDLLMGAGQFSVSHSGSLAHVPGGIYPVIPTSLVWVDHTGVDEALPLPTDSYIHPRFAPDGRRLAYVRGTAGDYQIWVYDIELKTPVRLTTTGMNTAPVWSPDGTRLVFASETERRHQLFWMPADGSGKAQRVTEGDAATDSVPASWSPEGTLAFLRGSDIWTVQMEGDGVPKPFLETEFREGWPAFSPDGRWLAYASNETGRFEVYVRPFPGCEPVHRVSTAGGASPLWSPSGQHLFFRGLRNEHPEGEMMVLDVTTGTTFTRSAPRELFDSPLLLDTGPVRSYDIAPDGRRFVMFKMSELEPQPVTRIHVALNWLEELNERVPVD